MLQTKVSQLTCTGWLAPTEGDPVDCRAGSAGVDIVASLEDGCIRSVIALQMLSSLLCPAGIEPILASIAASVSACKPAICTSMAHSDKASSEGSSTARNQESSQNP